MDIDLYEMEYLFLDELKEKLSRNRVSNVIVYDSETELGGKLASALNNENFAEVDDILSEHFGLKDDDVCFYYNWNSLAPEDGRNAASLILNLQKDQDIIIYELDYIEGV